MKNLRSLASLILVLGASATLVGCTTDDNDDLPDATLRVTNQSDFVIEEIRVTTVDSSSWGPNLLRGDALFPDESLTIDVDCATYDALLVDEDGVECHLDSVTLCFNDADWVIFNSTCNFAALKAARDEALQATTSTATK